MKIDINKLSKIKKKIFDKLEKREKELKKQLIKQMYKEDKELINVIKEYYKKQKELENKIKKLEKIREKIYEKKRNEFDKLQDKYRIPRIEIKNGKIEFIEYLFSIINEEEKILFKINGNLNEKNIYKQINTLVKNVNIDYKYLNMLKNL